MKHEKSHDEQPESLNWSMPSFSREPDDPAGADAAALPVSSVLNRLGLGQTDLWLSMRKDQLRAALEHPEWTVRASAAHQLGALRPQETAVALLLQALEDENGHVRAAAARSLGSQGTRAAVQPLLLALQDPEWPVRAGAALALGHLAAYVPAEPLVDALADDDASVRATAAWALGKLGKRAPIEALVSALHDPDWSVREAAALALGELQDLVSLATIVAAQADEDSFVRKAIHEALAQKPADPIENPGRIFSRPAHQISSGLVKLGNYRQRGAEHSAQHDDAPLAEREPEAQMPLHLQYEDIRREGIAARPGLGRRSRLIALAERSAAVVLILAVVLFWLASPNWRSLLSASPPSPTPILIHNSDPSLPLPIAWSSDSLHVAIPRDDGSVEVWDSATGERISTYHYYPSRVISVVWISASYFLVASEMPNRTVQVWNTPSEAVLFTTPPLPGEATVAAWSPNGGFIAFDGGDNSVQVWNINTGKLVQVYTQQKNRVAGLAWSPDSQQIASIGYDQTIQVWDATTGQQSMPSFVYGEAFTTLAWSPLQRSTPSGTIASIALAMLDGTVEIWIRAPGPEPARFPPIRKGRTPPLLS